MTRGVISIVLLGLCMGCNHADSPATDLAAAVKPAAFNVSGAPTVEFSVPDMMCPESCAVKVKEILAKQSGAKDVLVDFDSKTATVAIDKNEFNAQKALAALFDHQFKNSALKGGDMAAVGTSSAAAESKAIQ